MDNMGKRVILGPDITEERGMTVTASLVHIAKMTRQAFYSSLAKIERMSAGHRACSRQVSRRQGRRHYMSGVPPFSSNLSRYFEILRLTKSAW